MVGLPDISITVFADGEVIGSGSGYYVDEQANLETERIVGRSLSVSVVDSDGLEIGNGTIEYDDYVCYNGGGVRTVSVTGSVVDEFDEEIGTIEGSFEDHYGSTIYISMNFIYQVMFLVLLLMLIIVLLEVVVEDTQS